LNEHPELRCRMVDLSPHAAPEEVQALFEELWANDPEEEIILRGRMRYVHRLMQVERDTIWPALPLAAGSASQPFRLEIAAPGMLDQLRLHLAERRPPEPGEVEIRVHTAGLNFKDVMIAMGMLPDEALEGGYTGRSFGMECVGTVATIGAGVTGFEVGDEVIAIAPGCFGSFTTTRAELV